MCVLTKHIGNFLAAKSLPQEENNECSLTNHPEYYIMVTQSTVLYQRYPMMLSLIIPF